MVGGATEIDAAICGALLDVLQEQEAVPLRWRRQVLGCRPVVVPITCHPHPAFYRADDTMELAEALATATWQRAKRGGPGWCRIDHPTRPPPRNPGSPTAALVAIAPYAHLRPSGNQENDDDADPQDP